MRLRLATAACALLAAAPAPAAADDVDLQLWLQAVATLNLGEWRVHLEEQPRWNDDISQSFQVITRVAGGRRINGALTVWAGHAWIAKPPGPGVAHEQRAWEQASITLPAARGWAPAIRIRQEQRWQQGWADGSHRLRAMARVVKPVTADNRWSFAGWDEAMITFDETAGGPIRGFDQNRVFGGLLYRLTRRETLEFGYMWVATRNAAGPVSHAFVPFVWLNMTY